MGLLLSHNCTLIVSPDMFRITKAGDAPEVEPEKRGEVTGFSWESRKRLIRMLHTLEFEDVTFVTLTYPAVYPSDGREVKNHLRAWRERLQRKYGKLRVVWRLEFQKRGAPHYHLLILDAPFLDKGWISDSWYEVCGTGDERHRKAGTNIQLVTNRLEKRLVLSYVGKYIGKVDQAETPEGYRNAGRYWGKWNIPKGSEVRIEIDSWEAFRLCVELSPVGVDGKRYEPDDFEACTILGDSVGCDDFANRVIRVLAEIRARRSKREARIGVPIGVQCVS